MLAVPPASSRIQVPGATIEVSIVGEAVSPSQATLLSWVEKAGRAVAAYYGSFPVPSLDLTIRTGGAGSISGGLTRGQGGHGTIRIFVGQDTTAEDFESSWELVHEMVHLAFPSMTGQAWIEEGVATYVEPLVRARAGLAPTADIWAWLLKGAPQGLQAIAAQGLDVSRSWAATYWGGALFCFLADVEIRQKTGNRKSLDDALRGIVKAGGNVTMSWPLKRALEEGDRATGVPVLMELYAKMGSQAMPVDLPDLWKKLGVSRVDGRIVYDDKAPLAAVRSGITTGR
jgi:predicted metalloprotease with PDZ domain